MVYACIKVLDYGSVVRVSGPPGLLELIGREIEVTFNLGNLGPHTFRFQYDAGLHHLEAKCNKHVVEDVDLLPLMNVMEANGWAMATTVITHCRYKNTCKKNPVTNMYFNKVG